MLSDTNWRFILYSFNFSWFTFNMILYTFFYNVRAAVAKSLTNVVLLFRYFHFARIIKHIVTILLQSYLLQLLFRNMKNGPLPAGQSDTQSTILVSTGIMLILTWAPDRFPNWSPPAHLTHCFAWHMASDPMRQGRKKAKSQWIRKITCQWSKSTVSFDVHP